MERTENRSSVLENKVHSFSAHLTALCQRYIDLAPIEDICPNTGCEKFKKFIDMYSFEDDSYMSFISDCGIFAASNPVESFQIFENMLPKIDLESSSQPKATDKNRMVFTDNLKNINWSIGSKKAAVFCLIETVFSDFLSEMLSRIDTLSDEQVEFFYSKIIGFVNTDFKLVNSHILSKIADSRIEPMYFLSKKNPKRVFSLFQSRFGKEPYNQTQKIAYFKTFSNIIIEEDYQFSFKNQIEGLYKDYVELKGELHDAIGNFLHNICIQLLRRNPDAKNSNLFIQMIHAINGVAHSYKSLSSYSFYASSILYTEDSFSTVDEFFYEEIEKASIMNGEDVEIYCKGLVTKLYGDNYEPEIRLRETREFINWRPEFNDIDLFYKRVAAWIESIHTAFNDANEYASQLLEMLCYIDINLFIKYIFPVLNNQTIFTSAALPFIKGMYRVLSTAEEYDKIDNYDELKTLLLKVVVEVIIHLNLDMNVNNQKLIVNSFTAGLTASSNDTKDQLTRMCKYLPKTSFPIFTKSDGGAKSDAKIEVILKNFDVSKDKTFIKDAEQVIGTPTELQITINEISVNVLMLSMYMNPTTELMNMLCLVLFDESLYTEALASRVFQAMVHRNGKFAELIINQLCGLFIEQDLTFITIINIINTLMHVLEATNIENIQLSASTMNQINYVLIIGLCIPLPGLRNVIFEMCNKMKTTNNSNFSFIKFLEETQDMIAKRAQNNAINLISNLSEIDMKFMPYAKFIEVANSNYSSLYIFYIASVGYYLVRNAKDISLEFQNSLLFIHKILIKLLLSSLDEEITNKEDVLFQYNCAAMLISISDINCSLGPQLSYFNMKRIQHICRFLIDKLIETNDNTMLTGIFSSCGKNLFNYLIPILSEPVIGIQKSLVLTMRDGFLNKTGSVIDEYGQVSMPIYSALQSTMITTVRNNIIQPTFQVDNSRYNIEQKQFAVSLEQFAQSLKMAFDEIYEAKIKENPFNNTMWFIFFNNILLVKGAPFSKSMAEAFASWIRISKIPEKYFNAFTEKILEFSEQSVNISVAVFQQNSNALTKTFIDGAKNNFSMFMGLALQIKIPNNAIKCTKEILNDEKRGKLSNLDTPIAQLYYENVGNLLALCFIYLVSQVSNQREEALNFIEKLVLITMIKRNSVKEACIILKAVMNVRPALTTSFAVFIQKDIYQIANYIAKYFEFCSEQFISQCFIIVEAKNKTGNKSILKRPTVYKDLKQGRSGMIRGSTLAQRVSIYGLDQDLAIRRLKSHTDNRIDNIEIEVGEIIMNLIPLWLKHFTCSYTKPGICMNCEEHFRCYGIYEFIKELLDICKCIGMIQAISIILDRIIEKDPEYFVYCLISIQNRFEDLYKTSAQAFLIYIYNKDSNMFLKCIKKYFTIHSWYFFNIQVPNRIENNEEEYYTGDIDLSYTSGMIFLVDLIIECFKENEELLEPISPYLIVYCDLMTSDTYSKDNELPMIEDELYNKLEQLMSMLIKVNDKRKYKNVLPLIYKQCKVSYLMEWSFCCGWLPAAKRALTMFNSNGNIIKKNELDIVLRAMQCVIEIVNERTDPTKKSLFNKSWKVSLRKNVIDVVPAINYLTECLVTVRNYLIANKETESDNTDIINVALQFLSYNSSDHPALFTNAAYLLSFFIKNTKNIELLTSKFENGIFNYFGDCMQLGPDALEELRTITFECATRRLFKLFASDAYLLYILIPFMLNQANDEFCEQVSNSFTTHSRLIYETLSDKSRSTKILNQFNKKFIQFISRQGLDKIMHIYAQIAKCGDQQQREAVICMTCVLMEYIPNTSEQSDFATIAQIAVINQECHNNEAVISFIKGLIKMNITLENIRVIKTKLISLFPHLNVYSKDKIFGWKAQVENVFESPQYYPPLYVIDGMFTGAEFLEKENRMISKIREPILTEINDRFTSSVSVSKALSVDAEATTESVNAVEFLEALNKMASEISLLNSGNDQEITSVNINEIITVTANIFFPGHPDIEKLGSSELKDLEIPFNLQ